MSRGILWMIWQGENDPTAVLHRSRLSAKHWHPELEQHVVTMPADSNLLCKSQMYDLSPFDETLFLDADTTVLGRLDYGFEKAKQHGIACCINANPWQRRHYNIKCHADAVEYSSGVVFFKKSGSSGDDNDGPYSVPDVFDRWNALSTTTDTHVRFMAAEGVREAPHNDQALFSQAMADLGFNPFVLPLNWNLYPKWQKTFWGELKILHGYDDIPPRLTTWNADQSRREAVIQCTQWPN